MLISDCHVNTSLPSLTPRFAVPPCSRHTPTSPSQAQDIHVIPPLPPSSSPQVALPCARWTTVTSRRQLFKILLDSRVFKHLKSPQVLNLKASNPSRSSSSYFPYSAHRSSPPPRTAFKPVVLRDRVLAPKLPPRSSSPTQAPAARSHTRAASPCLQSTCQCMRYTTMHPVPHSPLPALDGWVPEAQAAWIIRQITPALLPHRCITPGAEHPDPIQKKLPSSQHTARYAHPFIEVQAPQWRRHESTGISSPHIRLTLLQANSSASCSYESRDGIQHSTARSSARCRPPPPRPTAHRFIRHAPALRARTLERQARFI
ncbi:hypothetical protein C8J57DRAFT_1728283 [Mycena rebaudengoi]|nr:hypothetical protein C8J57DRAFT_1728283 [Mycena rebaudengoi]